MGNLEQSVKGSNTRRAYLATGPVLVCNRACSSASGTPNQGKCDSTGIAQVPLDMFKTSVV